MPRVLVIDDSPTLLAMVRDQLEAEGFAVATARNGAEALATFALAGVDVILLDVNMPQMDGYSVCAALRQIPECADVPILFMTSCNDGLTIQRAYDAGATDFIVKPVDPRILVHRLRFVLRAQGAFAALNQSTQRYQQLFEMTQISIWEEDFSQVVLELQTLRRQGIVDLRALFQEQPETLGRLISLVKVTDVNQESLKMYRAGSKEELMASLPRIFVAETVETLIELLVALWNGQPFFQGETVQNRLDGEPLQVIVSMALPRDLESARQVAVSIVDISPRKRSEKSLRQANRALRAISSGIHSLVTAADENALLLGIAQVIAEQAGYRFAWVGYVDGDDVAIRPVAHAGHEEGYLRELRVTRADEPYGQSPIGRAIRSGQPVITRNIPDDPLFDPWRERVEARGFKSAAAIPLTRGGQHCFGALAIYSNETDAFTEEELHLLQDLARHVSFGIMSLREKQERQEAQQALYRLSNFDSLTNLPNRQLFEDRLQQAMSQARRTKKKLAVIFLDVNQFKDVRNSLGMACGDQLLKMIAGRLQAALRQSDTVAHFEGAHFQVLLPEVQGVKDVALLVSQLLQVISERLHLDGQELFLTAVAGIALFPDDGNDLPRLWRSAELALKQAWRRGNGCYQFFAAELQQNAEHRLALENGLRRALENNELRLHFQPQIALATGQLVGAEALVRWEHPLRGLVPPGEFIPLAEELGLIETIDFWVLQEACRQHLAWCRKGFPAVKIAVNLSARNFQNPDLSRRIAKTLAATGMDPRYLECEVTESAVMADVELTAKILHGLKDMGICVSLDDFGTGYSSLGYLKRFPLTTVKIDRSFIQDVATDRESALLTSAIIALAHGLNLQVLAEGVEIEAQRAFLLAQGCDFLQGFLYSRPLCAADFAALLQQEMTGGQGAVPQPSRAV